MKFFEEVEQVSPEIYYHYSTLETLYEIIGSKTFRLTSIKLPRGKKEVEVKLYHDTDFIKSTLQLIDMLESGMEAEECNNLKKHFMDVAENWTLEKEQFCVIKNGILGYKDLCLEEI